MRDYLAFVAAQQERLRPGRAWRPLADTAVGVPAFGDAPEEWATQRRALDYYPEGALIWLEADVLIRTRSGGTRSFDDFCQRFFGAAICFACASIPRRSRRRAERSRRAVRLGYSCARASKIRPHAPLDGISNGWTLS
jgi:predicted metalloprotease with PDZ domain